MSDQWSSYDTERACWAAEEVPESRSVCGLGAEQRRRQAGLQRDLANRALYWSVKSFYLCRNEPNRCLTSQLPCCPFGEALADTSPFWNGTLAGMNLGSSSVRGSSTGGDSPWELCGPIKRTAVQSAAAWVNTDKISGGSSFSLLNPVDTWED